MKLSKNEVKTLAKNAKSITCEERETCYNGSSSQTANTVSSEEMIETLSHCSRWAGNQYGDTVLVSASTTSFTIEL